MASKLSNFLLIGEAIYSLVKGSLEARVSDRSELIELLQLAGCNPSTDVTLPHVSRDFEFVDFCDALRGAAPMNEISLRKAFQFFDQNKRGWIDAATLNALLVENNLQLSEEEMRILNIAENGDFNYEMFLTNSKKLALGIQALALKHGEYKCTQLELHNDTENVKSATETGKEVTAENGSAKEDESDKSIDILDWKQESHVKELPESMERRGFFLFDHNTECPVLINHRYILEISEAQTVRFEIEHLPGAFDTLIVNPIDVWLILFNSSREVIRHSVMMNAQDVGKSALVANLQPDRYTLVPFTTQAQFKPRKRNAEAANNRAVILATNDTGKCHLTKEIRLVLMNLFDLCDLDNTGTLSREEFNLYNLRTGDEVVTDAEWEIIQEHFEMNSNELSLRNFLNLHQMEAEDSNGDVEDMWLSLESLGCNYNLQLDEICPFSVHIHSDKQLPAPSIALIQSFSNTEWLALTAYFSEQALSIVAQHDTHSLYSYNSDGLIVLLLQTEISSATQKPIFLNLEGSKNILFNIELQTQLSFSNDIEIIAFGVPKNPHQPAVLKAVLT